MQQETSKPLQDEAEVPAWTAEQAQAWRARNPGMPLWLPVVWQGAVVAIMLAVALITPLSRAAAASLVWGGLAALVPAVLSVSGYRTTMRLLAAQSPGSRAVLGMVAVAFWELVKLAVSVLMLVRAPQWLSQVNWLVLVLAFIAVLKSYWLAVLWVRMRPQVAG